MNASFLAFIVFLSLVSSSHQRFFLTDYSWDCKKCQVILIRTHEAASAPLTYDSFREAFENYVNAHICIPGQESPECGRLDEIAKKFYEQILADSNHKLRVQLQQQTPAENFKYRPLEQSRDPWTNRNRGREYRGGRQQDQIYHPGYRKPEPTFQRPQYDSSPRYRPDFEPNHCFRSDFDGNQRYKPDYDGNQRYKPDYDGNQRFKPDYNGSQHYRPNYGTNQQSRPEFEPNQRFQKKQYSPSYSPKTDSYRKNLTTMALIDSKGHCFYDV
uniref:Uncharacterized protein n=1 Tax=Ditylenchus dipsaci TaxID=166011 RepID=A0A915CXY2_9BILA